MNTPLRAMLWELWRTSRGDLLIRVGAQAGLIVLISLIADLGDSQIQVLRGVAVMIVGLVSLFSGNWLGEFDSRQSGFSFRLGFTRPVSTTTLVVVPMLFTVVTAAICFLLPALVFRAILDPCFPLVGPASGIACLMACLVATTWSAGTAAGKRIAISVLAGAVLVALIAFHARHNDPDPFVLAMGKAGYFRLAWYESAFLFAVFAAAIAVAIAAVDRQRHGDAGRQGAPGRRRSLSIVSRRPRRPFTSPVAAQCWYEMRRFGNTVLLLGIVVALLVFIAVSILPWFSPGRDASPQIWLIALSLCPLLYQIIGADGAVPLRRTQGAIQLSAFDATRPMRSDQLIAIKLLIIAACSLFGCLCMAAAAALHASLAGDARTWARIGQTVTSAVGDVPARWWLIGLCNIVLLYTSSTSAFLAFGLWLPLHRKLFGWLIGVVYLHMFVAAMDAAYPWTLRPLWTAYGYVIASAIAAGCVLALYKALRAGFLGRRLFAGGLGLWTIYVSSTLALYSRAEPAAPVPAVLIALAGALLLVPLATTAFAPLALAAHRHA